jgi:RNA-directed DNA polymerase
MSDISRQITSQEAFPSSGMVQPSGREATADLLIARQPSERPMFNPNLMEAICERSNLIRALERVVQNHGAPGVDGMSVEALPEYLKAHWLEIKAQLLQGHYVPACIKRVEIPKPNGGGNRQLCIPTVLDRMIQQAVLQVLQPRWDATFSDSSFGFRPGRSAHQAVARAQSYLQAGYEWVVDLDLEKFFDRVNHDKLMSHLAQQIEDKRVLKLIRGYLAWIIHEESKKCEERA